VIPTIPQAAKMHGWATQHRAALALSANDLSYGGGIDVTTGHEQVYLVFYGSQWGTQGTDANGSGRCPVTPPGRLPISSS
jgi:serine protease